MYARFQPLLPYLEAREDIEDILEEFQLKAETDGECRSQLLAVQYYIGQVVRLCEGNWNAHTDGASNYKTLFDQVRSCSPVCFVTFNYDTLIETALKSFGLPLKSINDYISDPAYKLIKLHGSIDWLYWIPKSTTRLPHTDQPSPDELIRSAPVPRDRSFIDRVGDMPPAARTEPHFSLPALAVPTVSKQTFVCPPGHTRALADLIPNVTEILLIGWRAAERHFLKLLSEGLQRPVRVMAVCGDVAEAFLACKRMEEAGIHGEYDCFPGGFSEFVISRRCETFLTQVQREGGR